MLSGQFVKRGPYSMNYESPSDLQRGICQVPLFSIEFERQWAEPFVKQAQDQGLNNYGLMFSGNPDP